MICSFFRAELINAMNANLIIITMLFISIDGYNIDVTPKGIKYLLSPLQLQLAADKRPSVQGRSHSPNENEKGPRPLVSANKTSSFFGYELSMWPTHWGSRFVLLRHNVNYSEPWCGGFLYHKHINAASNIFPSIELQVASFQLQESAPLFFTHQ